MANTSQNGIPTTQRAYTVRLHPACPFGDQEWKQKTAEMQAALWATHEAVNRGAKVFGDWLLTLRGGLGHTFADMPVPQGKAKAERPPTDGERRNRRILLALSWLSVEDESGASANSRMIVAFGDGCKRQQDCQRERNEKLIEALRCILEAQSVPKSAIGVPQMPGTWLGDCAQSISSAIRPDAVWVNRSALFSQLCTELPGLNAEYAAATTFSFFGSGEKYFFIDDGGNEDEAGEGEEDEAADFRQKARQWVSTNFGTGKKSDNAGIAAALERLAGDNLDKFSGRPKAELMKYCVELLGADSSNATEDSLRAAVGWNTGRPSKGRLAVQNLPDPLSMKALDVLRRKLLEEAEEKKSSAAAKNVPAWIEQLRKKIEDGIGIPYVTDRNLIGEYSVMLDHAARRVSIAHTWTKRAEAERRRFSGDAERIHDVLRPVRIWLDQFSEARSGATGAAGEYRIRPRALPGWDLIVQRWSKSTCQTEEDRIAVAREVQADWEDNKKFGDIQLFEALATDDARCAWSPSGNADPDLLKRYVAATNARARQAEFKVPAYRHPHPLTHPVFCDFGNSRWGIRFAVHEREHARRNGKNEIDAASYARRLEMGLWNGTGVQPHEMRWASKRLSKDLALDDLALPNKISVTLGSRFGRSTAPSRSPVSVLNVFDENDWNGRLQVPRSQLDRIALLFARNRIVAAEKLRQSLHWSLTFSPRLQPSGPFHEFAAQRAIKPNRKGEYFPNAELNRLAKREGKAKLVLSRFPGLRLLSVDLGHRFAAACAVWEALAGPDFAKEISGRIIESGNSEGLYLHTRHVDGRGVERITIYRRVGLDTLPDGSPHPAPWARLDRQFLIKLQGEEHSARKAAKEEQDAVRRIEDGFGRMNQPDDLPKQVDELMSHAVRVARLALRRHGDRARIAFAMTSLYKPMPGDRKYSFCPNGTSDGFNDTPEQRHLKHIEFIQDALLHWYDLFSSKGWQDQEAERLWQAHIAHLPGYQCPESVDEDSSGPERKKNRNENFGRLHGTAEALIDNAQLRSQLHAEWKRRWESDDQAWRGYLRHLQLWARPPASKGLRTIRRVGGLSLTRLATLTELRRKVQVGFFTRLFPSGDKATTGERFGQKTLDAIELMREQRVKQLASRIIEAALGVGRMKPDAKRDLSRPQVRVDQPCHAVVIESLRNYRPDELQTRRENRALMEWSSGKVRKYLEEACQLYGLYLREVPPNYTSRQCSRTGLPGIRCADVPIEQFRTASFWRKTVNSAKKRLSHNKGTEEDRLLCDLEDAYGNNANPRADSKASLRLPRRGGDLFVAAPTWEQLNRQDNYGNGVVFDHSNFQSSKRALQADLNAAANIGLRTLLDPDFPGTWWYVPCNVKDGKAAQEKVQGSACFADVDLKTLGISEKSATKREVVNAWCDPSTRLPTNCLEWRETTHYWNAVRARAVEVLRQFNGLPRSSSAPIHNSLERTLQER